MHIYYKYRKEYHRNKKKSVSGLIKYKMIKSIYDIFKIIARKAVNDQSIMKTIQKEKLTYIKS